MIEKHSESEILAMIKTSLDVGHYVILPHARLRCQERKVLPRDIEVVLKKGKRIKSRDRFDPFYHTWSYVFEGKTIEERDLRVVIIINDKLQIVTVVILEHDWKMERNYG